MNQIQPPFSFTNLTENSTVIPPTQQQQIAAALEDDAEVMSNTALEQQITGQPPEVESEVLAINDQARDRSLQVALLIPLLAALLGLANSFRMLRLPDLNHPLTLTGRTSAEPSQPRSLNWLVNPRSRATEGKVVEHLVARPPTRSFSQVGLDEGDVLRHPGRTGIPLEHPQPSRDLGGSAQPRQGQVGVERPALRGCSRLRAHRPYAAGQVRQPVPLVLDPGPRAPGLRTGWGRHRSRPPAGGAALAVARPGSAARPDRRGRGPGRRA